MDVRTIHPGSLALGRRRAPVVQAPIHATAAAKATDVGALVKGSSMRLMEAGLAIVALGTALLIGLGR